ncbi:hypothetical protein PRK78_000830 [Emydomyces testavorans]|uniref:Uncharacterized protein n=1 Tax=Emydomyces testavorans TaxID=2070801 RepID=A0AAF0DC56_9EURO|nr:hypothetical protein PRK78_000830 [Emydomyces testavorans]
MAKHQVLSDQRRLTAEHFKEVPWPVAKYLWDCLKQVNSLNLHMWKIFVTVYGQELKEEDRVYTFRPRSKQMPMREYFNLLNSNSLCWQTTVSFSTEFVGLADLVDVSSVYNLVFLEVTASRRKRQLAHDSGPGTSVTDRVIRSWSDAVRAGKAFRYLRCLSLDGQTEVTKNFFPYLDNFPTLSGLVLRSCPQMKDKDAVTAGARHGWQVKRLDPQKHSFEKWKILYTSKGGFGNLQKDPGNDSENDTWPTLHFHLGSSGPSTSTESRTYHFRRERPVLGVNSDPSRIAVEPAGVDALSRINKPVRRLMVKASKKKDMDGILADFTESKYI